MSDPGTTRRALGGLGALPPRRGTIPLAALPARTRSKIPYVPLAQTAHGKARAIIAARNTQIAQPHARSLAQQVQDSATGIISGVPKLGISAFKSVSAPLRIGVDVARGKLGVSDALQAESLAFGGPAPGRVRQTPAAPGADKLLENYAPLQSQIGQSMGRTIGRIRHPSRYLKASREGNIVDAGLEDVTNASLVAAPLSSGLTAGAKAAEEAGLARTAAVLGGAQKVAEVIHTAGGKINDAPISLFRKGLTGAREGGLGFLDSVAKLEPGAQVPADAPLSVRLANRVLPKLQGAAEGMRDVAPLRLRDEGIAMKGTLRDSSTAAPRAAARAGRDLFKDAGIVDKSGITPERTAEQGAAVALMNGVAATDKLLREAAPHLDPEQIRQMHTLRDIPEQTYTPDVAEVVRKYQDGTLDPEAVDRIHTYQDAARKQLGGITERALEGSGRVKGKLDPQQLGDAPIDRYVLDEMHKAEIPKHLIDIAERARSIDIPWSDMEKAIPELGPILDNPQVYPKAWRPAMQTAALGNQALSELDSGPVRGLPSTRPDALLASGVERPQYMSSSDSNLAQPKRIQIGRERVNEGTTGVRGVASENRSMLSEVQPYSARTMAESLGREASQTAYNEHFLAGVEKASLPKVHQILEPDTLARIDETTRRQVAAQRLAPGSADARAIRGRNIVNELEQRGLSVIEGDINNPQVGDFNPDSGYRFDQIDHNATVIPAGVKRKLVQYWAEKGGGVPARVLDWINKKFKGNVLPFSVRWQVGDMVGGAFMAWVGGGMPPTKLAAGMIHAKQLSESAAEEILNHPDWADASLSQGDRQLMVTGPDAPTPKTPIGKLKQQSFKLNNAINRVNRNGYLVAKVDELLAEKHLSIEGVDAGAGWKDPQVQAAVKAAVDDASKVMGTFDEMTPFEQRYMKRIFPFWAWNRHITALAFRTLIDDPIRIAWTMRLGSYGTDPTQQLPAWMKGSIGLGDKLIPTAFANPFNDVGGGDPIYTGKGFFKSMSPGIKLGFAAGLGADANNGLQQFSRPGRSPTDKGIHPLLFHPAELAYQAAKSFPPARVGLDVAPSGSLGGIGLGPSPRYGTGETIVDKSGKPIATDSRLTKLAGLIGLPVPTSRQDAAAIVAGTPTIGVKIGRKVKIGGKAKTRKVKLR